MSVPSGGMVTVNVGFYSDNRWPPAMARSARWTTSPTRARCRSRSPSPRTSCRSSPTRYTHKEIIVLNSQGNHQWEATLAARDRYGAGRVRERRRAAVLVTGITVSTINAAVGYAWESYNSKVVSCGRLRRATAPVRQHLGHPEPAEPKSVPGLRIQRHRAHRQRSAREDGLQFLPRPEQ